MIYTTPTPTPTPTPTQTKQQYLVWLDDDYVKIHQCFLRRELSSILKNPNSSRNFGRDGFYVRFPFQTVVDLHIKLIEFFRSLRAHCAEFSISITLFDFTRYCLFLVEMSMGFAFATIKENFCGAGDDFCVSHGQHDTVLLEIFFTIPFNLA